MSNNLTNIIDDYLNEDKKLDIIEKKKRGRKPKNKDLIINNKKRDKKNSLKLINLNENKINNIIVHLPLKMNDIVKITTNNINLNKYIDIKDEGETSINIDINDNFTNEEIKNNCVHCNNLLDKINELKKENENLKNGVFDYSFMLNKKIHNCQINLIENYEKNILDKSDIVCWWCCHKFDNIPLGIPEIIYKNNFYIY